MKEFLIDKKNLLILLLGILFLLKAPQEDVRFILWMVGGLFLAAGLDTLIKCLFLKQKLIIPKSAIISGFIIGGIIDYHQPWTVLVVFSLLAIASKYIVRFKSKQIFNPAIFSLFICTLFGIPLTWIIESNIYLIIIFGIYIAYSIKKITHIIGFITIFTILFAAQGINPLSIISWFFVFVMLIEPKTSGFGKLRGFMFGGVAGVVSFLAFKYFSIYDFFVSSLFVANIFNLARERLANK